MVRFRSTAVWVACAIVVWVAPVGAATVDQIAGSVQVNTGDGFKRITGPVTVAPGTSVMVEAGGRARILYSNNCFVSVQPGTVITVVPDDQCVPATNGSSLSMTQVGVGAAIIGGGVAAALLLGNKSDNNKPASP